MTPKQKLERLKEALSHDDRIVLIDVLNSARYSAYDAGYKDALKCRAVWNNGQELVGSGTLLSRAVEERKHDFFYRPDVVDLLPDRPCLQEDSE